MQNKNLNPLLAVVVVVATVLVLLLLAVRSYQTGADIGLNWAGLVVVILGGAVGAVKLPSSKTPAPPEKEGITDET